MLVKRYTQDPDAYNLYLEGRFYWNKRTEEGLKRSIELFEQAIAKDPKFALAYAGIADAYNVLAGLFFLRPNDAFPKAKEAAEKALEIDDTLAEGYISLATIKSDYDWDWMGAEIDFNWAIGLNPSYATAYQWYGILLRNLGRFDEAVSNFEKAKELDPSSLPVNTASGVLFYYARQYDRAIKECRKALEIDPGYPRAHEYIGLAYLEKKSFKKALKELEKAEKLTGGKGLFLADIAYAQAVTGNQQEAQETVRGLIERSEKSYVPAYLIALIFAARGDKNQAFEYLEKAYEERDTGLTFAKVDPRLDPLRDDPRFEALLEKVRLK